MVTHPNINRARRRVTTLIKTNALPLSQATTGIASRQSASCTLMTWFSVVWL